MATEYFSNNKFSPQYNYEAEALKMILCSKKHNKRQKVVTFKKFADKFTTIPALYANLSFEFKFQIWDIFWLATFDESSWPECHHLTKSINYPTRFSHVIFNLTWMLWNVEKSKLYLLFPNSFLTNHYDYIHMYSASPLSQKLEEKYRQSLQLYQKIRDSESSNTEWLKLIKEVNDIDFAIQNIECRIGRCPEDKEMWKLYIQFLKDIQLYNMMFHTYSRYCSLFTYDLKMREEFKNEVEKIAFDQATWKWKIDIIKIERNSGTFKNAISLFNHYFSSYKNTKITNRNFKLEFQKLYERRKKRTNPLAEYIDNGSLKSSIKRKSKKCLFKNDAIHQTLSLPSTAINFMLKNAKYDHLKKLYETSKYFYARLRSPLCYKIMIGVTPATVTFEQSLYVPASSSDADKVIQKFHVKEMIFIQSTPPSILSSIIKTKIYNCEISTLSLVEQNIHVEDFLKLISTVENLIVYDSYILNEERQNISVPEVVGKMPAIKFASFKVFRTSPPFPYQSKMPLTTKKLERFECTFFNEANSATKTCEFLSKNLASNASVKIRYQCGYGGAEMARICILEMFDSWKKVKNFKPNVKIHVATIGWPKNVYRFP